MTEADLRRRYPWIGRPPSDDLAQLQELVDATEAAKRVVALILMPFAPDGRPWQ